MDFIFFGIPFPRPERQRIVKSPAERKDEIIKKLHSMPLEIFHSREDYNVWTKQKLKKELKSRGFHPDSFDSKADMVDCLIKDDQEGEAGTSAESCGICICDYESEDVIRTLLPCSHKFHIECVDKWCMSAVDFSKPVSCPVCNTQL